MHSGIDEELNIYLVLPKIQGKNPITLQTRKEFQTTITKPQDAPCINLPWDHLLLLQACYLKSLWPRETLCKSHALLCYAFVTIKS